MLHETYLRHTLNKGTGHKISNQNPARPEYNMSKKVVEYCNVCGIDTPHRIRHRITKNGGKEYKGMNRYEFCLTCGTRDSKMVKAKTTKHISLHG